MMPEQMPAPQKTLRIGYLMNAYPMTSTTFIRREIYALEALGNDVRRYAIRPWSEALVDPLDVAEQQQTHYLLVGHKARLFADLAIQIFTRPRGVFAALKSWGVLLGNARGGLIRHVAYFLEAASLARKLKQDGVEHVHAHFSTNTAAVALMAQQMGGPQFSFTVHGPDELIDWGPSSLKFKVTKAAFVAAISKFCRTQIALAAGHSQWGKIKIVRCGIDLEEFSASGAPFDAAAPFVCVGRLCPQKAQVLIVEAFAQVIDDYPGARLELVGDGESRSEIEAMINIHGLQDNIVLLGWRSNREVREILGRARALLLPSFAEGLPIVIMEALALERPVISTFIAGIPELVDNEVGWIIPAGSVENIAESIQSALETDPEELRSRAIVGRRRVAQWHDIKKNAAVLAASIEHAVRTTEDRD